jgi:hypothetical protein
VGEALVLCRDHSSYVRNAYARLAVSLFTRRLYCCGGESGVAIRVLRMSSMNCLCYSVFNTGNVSFTSAVGAAGACRTLKLAIILYYDYVLAPSTICNMNPVRVQLAETSRGPSSCGNLKLLMPCLNAERT